MESTWIVQGNLPSQDLYLKHTCQDPFTTEGDIFVGSTDNFAGEGNYSAHYRIKTVKMERIGLGCFLEVSLLCAVDPRHYSRMCLPQGPSISDIIVPYWQTTLF